MLVWGLSAALRNWQKYLGKLRASPGHSKITVRNTTGKSVYAPMTWKRPKRTAESARKHAVNAKHVCRKSVISLKPRCLSGNGNYKQTACVWTKNTHSLVVPTPCAQPRSFKS